MRKGSQRRGCNDQCFRPIASTSNPDCPITVKLEISCKRLDRPWPFAVPICASKMAATAKGHERIGWLRAVAKFYMRLQRRALPRAGESLRARLGLIICRFVTGASAQARSESFAAYPNSMAVQKDYPVDIGRMPKSGWR